MADQTDISPEFIVLKFADSRIPVFKELRNKDYIQYGDDNCYPEYLTTLYNKSAKHNAIITGKANYIFGNGFENGDVKVNRLGETLNDISRKSILDVEIYGGYRWEVIWNRLGKISEIYHVDYNTIRLAKEGGYYYKEKWDKFNRDEPEFIEAFNPNKPIGSQLFAYNEYRPGVRFYPLPTYIGCNNYIETDIEISKFHLSAIRNGMAPSKMIQFFKGEPGEEKKKEIERRLGQKFSGAENAGKFLLVFNDSNAAKSVEVTDLSASELDKQFDLLNKTTQQEIFSGHNVTSPMLFGIKTEGQLGGATELKTAYEIFINTYAKPKSQSFEKEVTYVMAFSMFPGAYEITQTDPIGVQFDVKDVIASIPKEFIFEKLGIPKEMLGPQAVQPGQPAANAPAEMVNENLKNLTGRQYQHVMRTVREYSKGKLTKPQASVLLSNGYGLSASDIDLLLGIEAPAAMSAHDSEDDVIAMFDACGESKSDYEILKSKKVCFSEADAEEDEEIWIHEAFKDVDLSLSETKILDLVKKDGKITAEVIAKAIGETKKYVESKLASLAKRGYIESAVTVIGEDEIIERTIPKRANVPPPSKQPRASISIKYSYEPKPGLDPIIPTTRPFCRKLIQLNRLYSRADIENISQRLGYSVFDRKGGWWGYNPECRHRWVSNILVRKGGQTS